MNDKTEKQPLDDKTVEQQPVDDTVKQQMEDELANLQTKIDEAKLQVHLGAKDTQDKIQPYVDELEEELAQAKKQWNQFEDASEGAWADIQSGLSKSIKSMEIAFDKAKKHFPADK